MRQVALFSNLAAVCKMTDEKVLNTEWLMVQVITPGIGALTSPLS